MTAGRFNAAGLPGITGTVGAWVRMTQGTGAFYTPTEKAANVNLEDYAMVENNAAGTTFDASRCSSIYSASDTVMPASSDIITGIYLGRSA